MKVIGITGSSGSGKTTLSKILNERDDVKVINADKVVRELSVPGTEYLNAIKETFGQEVFLEDGNLNRKKLAKKIYNLRIFEDDVGKMNLSVDSVKGEILAVSQFTLCGDVSHGNRPSFFTAMSPEEAQKVYGDFCKNLRALGAMVAEGIFGADMQITQVNDGPVTIWYDI